MQKGDRKSHSAGASIYLSLAQARAHRMILTLSVCLEDVGRHLGYLGDEEVGRDPSQTLREPWLSTLMLEAGGSGMWLEGGKVLPSFLLSADSLGHFC